MTKPKKRQEPLVNEKTKKTAVVIIPPTELWPSIQTIRKKYLREQTVRRWMPHITMVFPFRPKEVFEALIFQLSKACEDIKTFNVDLTEFRFFHHGKQNYTLWLAPEPKEAIIGLQKALHSIVPDCNDVLRFKSGFTPHLSVAQVKGHRAMEKLRNSIQASWQPLSFTLSRISLIWREEPPDDVFRVGLTINLGN